MLMRNGSAPFPLRYAREGPDAMETVASGAGGLVQYPRMGLPEAGGVPQLSVVAGSAFDDLARSGRRAVTQVAIMHASPNEAARTLGLPMPTPRSWEWLHLVAFSIGQTHIDAPSAQSINLIQRTDQPQQIRENLVLGTAAANTAMLSYETAIKQVMREEPRLQLDLFVAAHKEELPVHGTRGESVMVPVATRIDYHFLFRAPDGRVTPPVVLAFDTRSHQPPPLSEHTAILAALHQHLHHAFSAGVHGLQTTGLTPVSGL